MTALRRPLTVRGRTTAVAALVVAVALAVGAVALVALLQTRLLAAERSAASLRASDVAALAQDDRLPRTLSFPGEDKSLTQVVDERGNIVAFTANLAGEPAISGLRPGAGSTTSEVADQLPIGDGARFVVVATSVSGPSGRLTVYSSASLDEVDETVRAVSIALALGVPFLVGLVAFLTRELVGRALRPVEQLRHEVSIVTDEDLHRRVAEPGTGDEIDRLAGTMNQMLGRLEEASERQRRFVADASHELRSPLASARASLEVAVAHPTKVDASAAMADALVDHGRLERLVDDLLLLARVSDHSQVRRWPLDLVGIVAEEVSAADDQRITVRSSAPGLVVEGDHRVLARIVRNLVDNARRHARSSVLVTCGALGEHVRLTVEDDGAGIAEADRERVFDRFTRLDDVRSRVEGGSGLGLAIVSEAVRDLGGDVSIFDSPLGGAGFEVRLRAPGEFASG